MAIDFGRISGSSPASYFPAQKGRFQPKAEDQKNYRRQEPAESGEYGNR